MSQKSYSVCSALPSVFVTASIMIPTFVPQVQPGIFPCPSHLVDLQCHSLIYLRTYIKTNASSLLYLGPNFYMTLICIKPAASCINITLLLLTINQITCFRMCGLRHFNSEAVILDIKECIRHIFRIFFNFHAHSVC